ncbi:MAG TPA: hypothetical protein VKV77_00780 [Methylovirgula sp.]|nr:hypothetical protein [Methylovirgula sp.]
MSFDKMTWIGLMVVALGWALLLSGAPTVEIVAKLLGHGALPFDLPVIAQATILTGFGLAVLGALQTGFGALKNFFDTVLERTAKPGQQNLSRPVNVVQRGRLKDRPYVLFGDGSVEVETLLGLRRFASFKEAHEFIGR